MILAYLDPGESSFIEQAEAFAFGFVVVLVAIAVLLWTVKEID